MRCRATETAARAQPCAIARPRPAAPFASIRCTIGVERRDPSRAARAATPRFPHDAPGTTTMARERPRRATTSSRRA
ncbi:hypothetical protein WL57_30435 [Burkholderia cepacia]|nr:hypothetical protein WL55_29810 [Burkholderia cepacia]KWC80361.1 hypothetical protein WL57_30435 [Burkholderia cepacia]